MENNIFNSSHDRGDLLRHYCEGFVITLKKDKFFEKFYTRNDGDQLLNSCLITVLDHSIMKFLQLQELLDNDIITVKQEAEIMTKLVQNHLMFFAQIFGLWQVIAKPVEMTNFLNKWNDFFLTGIKTMYTETLN